MVFTSGDLTPQKLEICFIKTHLNDISEPEYTGSHFGSPYTFYEGQFLDPEGLLDYLGNY